jgi:dTDP-4-amino-4,6-dideoxygalactose transaminase
VIALANLQRFPALLDQRRAQSRRLLRNLEPVPGLRALAPVPGEEWNCFAPLLRIGLPDPRAFAKHVARQGVPNSAGSFGLVPCDTRPMFKRPDRMPCRGAAEILDHTLAVILNERDTEGAIDQYVAVIAREASAWAA